MYYILKETTVYEDGTLGGCYFFNDKPKGRTAQMVGYIGPKTDALKLFKAPITIDMRGRTFKQVGTNVVPELQ
jgi:hypothetical protein